MTTASTERPPRRPAHWAVKGLFCIAAIFLLKAAQPLMAPVVIAVILTFVFATPVRWLRRRGIPEFIGAGILVSALLVVTVLFAAMLAAPAAQWWDRAPTTVSQLVAQFDRFRATIPLLAPPPKVSPRSQPPADPIKERIASEGVTLTGVVIGRSLSFSLSAVATVILLYFLLASEHWMLSRTVEAIPRRRTRAVVLAGVQHAQQEIGRFLAALGLINLGVGIFTGLAVAFVGLQSPILWGSVAAFLNFIPYIGPIMVFVLLLLAGLLTLQAADMMLAPAMAFLVIHAIESNFISPWFVGRKLSLSRVSIFLSVMFWGWLWGIAGAVIAVPVLIGLRNICKRNRQLRWLYVYLHVGQTTAPSLRSLLRITRRGGAGGRQERRPPAAQA
ncbi:MAG: AI-2E family transporter [Betaproteobacteria bacterium]